MTPALLAIAAALPPGHARLCFWLAHGPARNLTEAWELCPQADQLIALAELVGVEDARVRLARDFADSARVEARNVPLAKRGDKDQLHTPELDAAEAVREAIACKTFVASAEAWCKRAERAAAFEARHPVDEIEDAPALPVQPAPTLTTLRDWLARRRQA